VTDTTTTRPAPAAGDAVLPAEATRLSTGPDAAPPRPEPANVRRRWGGRPVRTLRRGWRGLTSMRTALVLLFLLAVAAVPGSVIPQRGLNAAAVTTFYAHHPTLAPILDRLGLFNVFGAPWFAAVYLLLFISLVGCLVPRIRLHARALRSRPPAAPTHLSRLRTATSWTAPDDPAAAIAGAATALRRRRFRVQVSQEPGGAVSLAAEKGYLRETGNLLFHVALVALLVGIALGGLWGYKGSVLVVTGNGFSNTLTAYDTFSPGRLFSPSQLAPFSVTVRSFHATYTPAGQPLSFDTPVTYTTAPGARPRHDVIAVNHPLDVDGTKVYLLGHGYAPIFEIRDPSGRLVYDAPTPFIPEPKSPTFVSTGVVKVPDARPSQLGFDGYFLPTAGIGARGGLTSIYPAARSPLVYLSAYRGNLGLDTGAPQSVYALDFAHLHHIGNAALKVGQSIRLPGGYRLSFTGVADFATYQTTYDPGRLPAFGAALAMVAGLILSLRVRRRRMWLRASPPSPPGDPFRDAGSPTTLVEAAGLARTDHDDFAAEFAEIVAQLAPASTPVPAGPDPSLE
jgi:cytochrome c biogenesis protein